MNRISYILAWAFLTCSLATIGLAEDLSESPTANRVSLVAFLTPYAQANHFFFTLEVADVDGRQIDPRIVDEGTAPIEQTSTPAYLRTHLPEFDILKSGVRSDTYNIIDKRLTHISNYALDHKYVHFRYIGNPVAMAKELAKGTPSIGVPESYSYGSPIVIDTSTPIDLTVESLTTREILTKALPQDYSYILWTARSFSYRSPSVEISFGGTRP